MSSLNEHPVRRAADDATNSDIPAIAVLDPCCTPPRYRPPSERPGYLMVETSSPDMAASCPLHEPQSWLPAVGKSKWALLPPMPR